MGIACALLLFFHCSNGTDSGRLGTEISVSINSVVMDINYATANLISEQDLLYLIIANNGTGALPSAMIGFPGASNRHIGVSAPCEFDLVVSGSESFLAGSQADNQAAIANVEFSRLELHEGGRISGEIIGLVEREGNPEAGLLSLELTFENVIIE
jgi:hypothetical protein